ncbi:Cysteine desulfurase, NifS [Moorella glycerini]|uniref:cysteine desulfurase n=1 Tax=Neomoorella stamsii TaxID=1266720 RepID=A0A9X7P7C0_9FIRM|nr:MULTISPECIES: cysteine desulfurase DndA [Moorella]PRR76745.1 Cysteine desulfurase [Moorella stamsii]CEP66721.1 Cysteine desulfurase, NifS [Moorella glycerini]
MPLYLDFNATTPVDPRVLAEMVRVYEEEYGNASSRTHRFGQRAGQLVETARGQIAGLLAVDKNEVIFTSGATESNNLAILGLAKWGARENRRHILATSIEHKAVLEPLAYLQKCGFEIELVPVPSSGRVDPEEVIRRVRPDTLLVTVMHANNETGVIQPVHEIGKALAGTDVYFHVDAAQTAGKLVAELQDLQYDLLSVSSHKMYGPQGIGALIVRRKGYRRPPLQPIMYGGGQEGGLRPGTLPVALIAGFGKAATIARAEHKQWLSKCMAIKRSILDQLNAVEYQLNGDPAYQMANCLNVSFLGVDSEALMLAIQDEIAISNGSACTSADYKPSHVLVAMGLSQERIESAVRLSWGPAVDPSLTIQPLISFVKNAMWK